MPGLLLAGAFVALTVGAAVPAAAEVRAIVVGFNDYATVPKLVGALTDASDVAGAFRKRGVSDLTEINDPRATVADFDRKWNEIVARSSPGDLIIFTFAGHGVRFRERRIPQKTADGFEKGFLFPTFVRDAPPDSPKANELLRDEDLYDRFQATTAKGLRVLFIADACHAGSGMRSADPRSGSGGGFRFTTFSESTTNLPTPVPQAKRPPLPGVAVVSAQLEDRRIREIAIDGQLRGALSYTFARGIEGAADPQRTGTITVDDLWQFTREGVRTRSDNDQVPLIYTTEAEKAQPVFTSRTATPAPTPLEPSRAERDLSILSLGRTIPIEGASFVTDRRLADLIWDPARRQLINAAGDVLSSEIGDADLQGAVDARRLIEYLRTLAETKGNLPVFVRSPRDAPGAPADRLYIRGEDISIGASERKFRFSTILDISADGTVTLLFPTRQGDAGLDGSRIDGVRVQSPFGVDMVVFINTQLTLEAVTNAFGKQRSVNGQEQGLQAREVLTLLHNTIDGLPVRIGMQSLVTCRALRTDKTCDSQVPSSP